MEVDSHVADWNQLVRQLKDEPDVLLFDVDELWVESPFAPGTSAHVNAEVTELFDKASSDLDQTEARELARVLAAFSAARGGKTPPRDLDLPDDDGIWYSAMSPTTLASLVASADELDRARLERAVTRAFAARRKPPEAYSTKSAAQCLDYYDSWVRVFRDAAAKGQGVLVSLG